MQAYAHTDTDIHTHHMHTIHTTHRTPHRYATRTSHTHREIHYTHTTHHTHTTHTERERLLVSGAGVVPACRLPLEGLKVKVKRNLKLLEAEHMVSEENDYQELINAIAKVRTCICL